MVTKLLNPLNWDLPIVDSQGRPTPEFARKWAQQFSINGTIPNLSTPAAVSAILDQLYSTPGGILVRGSSLWGGLASPADPTKFLNGGATPAFGSVHDTDLAVADVVGNNVSILAHGFAPKAPNDITKFLDGTGNWSAPAGGAAGVDWLGAANVVQPHIANFTFATSTTAPTGATGTDSSSAVVLACTAQATNRAMAALQNPPASTFTAIMLHALPNAVSSFTLPGFVVCDTVNSRAVFFGVGGGGSGGQLRYDYEKTNGGTYGIDTYFGDSNITNLNFPPLNVPFWTKLVCDATNFKFSLSGDGVHWNLLHTVSVTDYITNRSKVGFGVSLQQPQYPSEAFAFNAFSWKLTTP